MTRLSSGLSDMDGAGVHAHVHVCGVCSSYVAMPVPTHDMLQLSALHSQGFGMVWPLGKNLSQRTGHSRAPTWSAGLHVQLHPHAWRCVGVWCCHRAHPVATPVPAHGVLPLTEVKFAWRVSYPVATGKKLSQRIQPGWTPAWSAGLQV